MNTRRRPIAPLTLAAAVAVLAWALPASAQVPEAQTVVFTAPDGVQVTGSLFLPAKVPAPAVVLLHMATRNRHDWDATGAALAAAGVAALSVDFRPAAGLSGGEPSALLSVARDAEAARAYLGARPEVSPARIGMAGASLGANIAALVAAGDPSIRSLVLLSASLDYRGVRIEQAMAKYSGRPVLVVASSEDHYALRSARTFVTGGDGQRELRVLSGAGHGTVMLARQPDLVDALVDWFLRTLL
jgi:hypothetical protein